MNVSILVPSYGKNVWREIAETRALPSAHAQEPHEVLVGHDPEGTIASVRNELAEKATGTHLLFCDADDQLGPGFVQAMQRVWERKRGEVGTPLLLTPAVSYVLRGQKQKPHFSPEMDLREGNWLNIGTLVPRSLFLEIGGFREWPLYEDWDLWARCVQAGAEIVKVPRALYLAHVSRASRNRIPEPAARNYWHQKIGYANWSDYYDPPTQEEDELGLVAGVRKLQLA